MGCNTNADSYKVLEEDMCSIPDPRKEEDQNSLRNPKCPSNMLISFSYFIRKTNWEDLDELSCLSSVATLSCGLCVIFPGIGIQ